MLMDEYEEWKLEQANVLNIFRRDTERKDYENFLRFYEEHKENNAGNPLDDLAYEIYNLQICVEGLIEDLAR